MDKKGGLALSIFSIKVVAVIISFVLICVGAWLTLREEEREIEPEEKITKVEIVSHTLTRTNPLFTNFKAVLGEVRNVGETNVEGPHDVLSEHGVKLKATFYDNRGYIIDEIFSEVFIPVLVPNQKSPFYLETSAIGVFRYELEIVSYRESEEPYREFEVVDQELTYISYWDEYRVEGEVLNTGTAGASNVRVCATFYDSDGNVIGCGMSARSSLAPNEVTDFWVAGEPCGKFMGEPASYTLQVFEDPRINPFIFV